MICPCPLWGRMVFQDDFEGDGLNQNIQFGDNYTGSFDLD